MGDWSWIYRSPDGDEVLRVTPFDPGYEVFVELCRALPDHPHLPRLAEATAHREGGYSARLEYLQKVPAAIAEAFLEEMAAAPPSTPLGTLRIEMTRIGGRAAVPLFAGIDGNPTNVLRRPRDGRLVFIDAYWLRGPALLEVVRNDPATAIEWFGASHLVDWAHLPCMEPETTEEILLRIRSAS